MHVRVRAQGEKQVGTAHVHAGSRQVGGVRTWHKPRATPTLTSSPSVMPHMLANCWSPHMKMPLGAIQARLFIELGAMGRATPRKMLDVEIPAARAGPHLVGLPGSHAREPVCMWPCFAVSVLPSLHSHLSVPVPDILVTHSCMGNT